MLRRSTQKFDKQLSSSEVNHSYHLNPTAEAECSLNGRAGKNQKRGRKVFNPTTSLGNQWIHSTWSEPTTCGLGAKHLAQSSHKVNWHRDHYLGGTFLKVSARQTFLLWEKVSEVLGWHLGIAGGTLEFPKVPSLSWRHRVLQTSWILPFNSPLFSVPLSAQFWVLVGCVQRRAIVTTEKKRQTPLLRQEKGQCSKEPHYSSLCTNKTRGADAESEKKQTIQMNS